MGKQELAMLIPIMALLIPVAAIVLGGMVKIQKARLEEARLRHGDPTLLAEVDALREEVHQVRGELAEVQERLDFTERMLTARSAGGREEP